MDLNDQQAEDTLDLGPCCACEKLGQDVRNVIILRRKGPTPGKGWGCLVCNLPLDGAVAVLCDGCLESEAKIRFVCAGFPAVDGRVPIEELDPEPFDHNLSLHYLEGEASC